MPLVNDTTLTWQIIRKHLKHKKAQLYAQIGNYPTPITGCDEQFNHLLDEQRLVTRELSRLQQAENDSDSAHDTRQAIDSFIQNAPFSYQDLR
ncbi:MAG: hypothetical protein AAF629_09875 [Chloroflexota bacterium]